MAAFNFNNHRHLDIKKARAGYASSPVSSTFRYGRTCSSAVRNYSFKHKVHIATLSNSLHPHHQSPTFP
ncbi:hypothetical protein BKA82DRAFT_1003805 [Pisolithus tinctorius]|uniref:Uncharacterized protein n=1 Tax=Pisolithus tinctorius Marx 270 TaxID=870435 RepID=A0A0C3NZ39_PISTI|nr:hypothetical protein BKA82DRAFT_1003805 [Pisolithus tinctorius]KIO00354.1 hypothetical protein M404DRAFT_1003805 [Pisolithus tinctorius Marx 270]